MEEWADGSPIPRFQYSIIPFFLGVLKDFP
jgi:hypothetical protein